MMASEVASNAGGMWFSTWMWEGMAGELGMAAALSCTSRSKICDVAGEATRGEAEYTPPRPGDAGTMCGASASPGDVAAEDRCDMSRASGVPCMLDSDLADAPGAALSDAFFFPEKAENRPRFFLESSFADSTWAGALSLAVGVEQSVESRAATGFLRMSAAGARLMMAEFAGGGTVGWLMLWAELSQGRGGRMGERQCK